MTFFSIPFFLGFSFSGGFGEGPVWVATCSQCCFEAFLFLLCPLGCGGYFFGPMLFSFTFLCLNFTSLSVLLRWAGNASSSFV